MNCECTVGVCLLYIKKTMIANHFKISSYCAVYNTAFPLFTAGLTAYRICSEVLMDYIVCTVFF